MYFQKMVEKLGHKNENLVAMMTKFPSIRPSFTILGNLVNSTSSPTVYGVYLANYIYSPWKRRARLSLVNTAETQIWNTAEDREHEYGKKIKCV